MMHCTMFGEHEFRGFVLEILATFPHFQDEKEVIRRYEGWYYTKLEPYYIILYIYIYIYIIIYIYVYYIVC